MQRYFFVLKLAFLRFKNTLVGEERMKGGSKMADETKKPCEPMEEAGRDYTTVFCETDSLCAALDELCSALNFWYGSMNNPWQREDRAYRKMLAKQTQAALKRVLAESASES